MKIIQNRVGWRVYARRAWASQGIWSRWERVGESMPYSSEDAASALAVSVRADATAEILVEAVVIRSDAPMPEGDHEAPAWSSMHGGHASAGSGLSLGHHED